MYIIENVRNLSKIILKATNGTIRQTNESALFYFKLWKIVNHRIDASFQKAYE